MRPWNRGGVVGWRESKFWNDSAAFVWKKTGGQCSSSLWPPSIEKLLVISSCLLDYWVMSYSFPCCLLQPPSTVWAPSGACFSLLPARQSVNYRRPSRSRFERKTHSSSRAFPYCMFFFFFFFFFAPFNLQFRPAQNVERQCKSFNLPTSTEVRENPVKVYIFFPS